MSIPGHQCNAYCRPTGEHCELVYTDPQCPRDAIWREYATAFHVWVTDALAAHEAEPIDAIEVRGYADPIVVGSVRPSVPWLVWYRLDYQQARQDYERGSIPRYRSAA